ncbi:MAG: dTMP kinase [Armatimonadetes bacterium]|nr:dTMP kinase [Armatimonadota bacterium]
MSRLHESHNMPGKLIVVEGIDGSGKSTQAMLLQKWLSSYGIPTVFTEWNSSLLVKSTTKAAKKRNALTPTTFSLLHATDFADRLTYQIIPPLKGGMVVIADRYAFTAFARDAARGVDSQWVRDVYSFAIKPDISFYFRVSIDVSLERLLGARAAIKFYEAGMDVTDKSDPVESFRDFQGRVLKRYDEMSAEYDLTVMDATHPIDVQQREVRKVVLNALKDYPMIHRIPVYDKLPEKPEEER